MNQKYTYAVLCESDLGLDAFGNPIGEPILLECVGEQMNQSNALDRAAQLKASGQFGDVKVVRFEICEYQF